MSTTPHHYAATINGTQVVASVAIASCDDCGSLVGNPVIHAQNCSRIKPPPPPPVWEAGRTIKDRAWLATLFARHGYNTADRRCACDAGPMTELDHCDHLAEAVYRALEGRDE